MVRCIADGGSEASCELLWQDHMGIAPPKGVPLRPDRDALREAAMTSLARAALFAARSCRDPDGAYRALAGDRTGELLTRSPTTPTTLAGTTALQQIAMHFVASLVPVSAAAAVISRSLQLSFAGAAEIRVPSLSLPHAAWLTEGGPVPVVQGTSSAGAVLDPFKLAAGVVLSGEMIRNSNAEAFVRQVLLESVGPTLDAALLSNAAAIAGVRPAGILNAISPLTATAATSSTVYDAMFADLALIAAALAPVAGGGQPILVAAPAQAVALMRAPREIMPVIPCAALAARSVIGLAPTAIATAIEAPRIESSSETLTHLNDAPTDIGLPGAPPSVAARTISLYQSDSIAMKIVLPVAWSRRSNAAIAWFDAVNW
jgi:hypothetical protein